MNTVKINNEDYKITFNLNALRKFCKSEDMELNEVNKIFLSNKEITIDKMEKICNLIICGLDEASRLNKTNHSITIDDIFVEIGENHDFLNDVIKVYAEALPQKKRKLEQKIQ
jgi:hypothetical protein